MSQASDSEGAPQCSCGGGPSLRWRNQTLVVKDEPPRVVRVVYRCRDCGTTTSVPA